MIVPGMLFFAPGRARRLAGCAGLLLGIGLLGAPHAPGAVAAASAPSVAAGAGPLQLDDVALVQHDVRMSLRLATSGDWTAEDLTRAANRALCIALVHGDRASSRGRICVAPNGLRAGLSYTPLSADGTALATRRLPAKVTRPAPNVLEATFLPVAAGLSLGPYSWWAQAAWTDEAGCWRTCTDRFPDNGAVTAPIGLLNLPACFGAAARDPTSPCANPDLRLSVEPSLKRVNVLPATYCDTHERSTLLRVCGFGAAPEDAAGTFALVGDSHAAGLKPALQVVTLAKRWRGASIVRPGCPATAAPAPRLSTPKRSRQCVRWNRQLRAWLAEHGEVDTVFLASHVGAQVTPAAGQEMFEAVRAGYRDEIRALLGFGRRVVVIRDTPTSAAGHLRCVAAALSAARPPGTACAKPRAAALRPDPLVAAARAEGSPQVKIVDLTDHVCDDERCFAVVGGALVTRDRNHLTPTFSATLGPYLLRALDP